ncbi:MAG: hypothetical protein HYZ34_04450 [Ignavibacteriae bacterium]|nr:hypothetical protein [Ignavibacteriota bacterium]
MIQENIYQTIESQLSLLTLEEQQKVISFIDSLLQQHRILNDDDLQRLQQFIGIGKSKQGDVAAEHDHYLYGTPKKNSVNESLR